MYLLGGTDIDIADSVKSWSFCKIPDVFMMIYKWESWACVILFHLTQYINIVNQQRNCFMAKITRWGSLFWLKQHFKYLTNEVISVLQPSPMLCNFTDEVQYKQKK